MMGRIKSALIKRTAEKLLKSEGIEFEDDFGKNKLILGSIMPSKRMKNSIAGYITRLKKRAHAKQKPSKKTDSEVFEQA